MRASHQLGRVTCGNEPVTLGADPGAGPGSRKPGTLSAFTGCAQAPCGRVLTGRFLHKLAGAFELRPLLRALALSLALAGCEADHIGARATLQEWGYTGIAIEAGPIRGRPCRWGEPYAVRFIAHDAGGAEKRGWVCASDEAAEDALIVLDREGA